MAFRRSLGKGVLELSAVVLGFSGLTAIITYPLAFNLSTLGYKLHVAGDPQFSVWIVTWVAHALLENPLNVFNANIFYPHSGTLAYSEANLVAGAIGLPVYWLTGNAFATHNFVVLSSFVLNGAAMYYLARYLSGDRRAAAITGISFAYCPYFFGHLSHVHLLFAAGIPFSLLMFHRVVDEPSPGRGVALGLALGWQALACAYYAVFAALLMGLAVIVTVWMWGTWRRVAFWGALAVGAAVACAIVLPLFIPYLSLQRAIGFSRTLAESKIYAANLLSYVTSAAYLSSWLYGGRTGWTDVLFPGFLALVFGIAGFWIGRAAGGTERRLAGFYGVLTAFAFWESFGPTAGLYTLSYHLIPVFTFLRAPSRFGVIVVVGLAALASLTIARLLGRSGRPALVAAALLAFALAQSLVPVPWTPNPVLPAVYSALAKEPEGGLLELPVYSAEHSINRTRYMIGSTVHWKPLVNAYSDMTPPAFVDRRDILATFPSAGAFELLPQGVRYALFHLRDYRRNGVMDELNASIAQFQDYLVPLYKDDEAWLYEVTGRPPSGEQARRSP